MNQNPQFFPTGHFGPDFAEEKGRLHPVKPEKIVESESEF